MEIYTEKYQITTLKQSNMEQYSIYIPYDMIETIRNIKLHP